MIVLYTRVSTLPRLEEFADQIDAQIDVHLLADGAPIFKESTKAPEVAVDASVALPDSLAALEREKKISIVRIETAALTEIRRSFGC